MRNLMNDTVTVIHKDGARHENVRASVQKNKIFIADARLPLSAGDLIERSLPSGQTEVLRSTNVHLWTGKGGIPSYYEIDYEREGATRPYASPAVKVHISESPQAHINLNSTDQSTSVITGQNGDIFSQIRDLIKERLSDSDDCDLLLEKVEYMERNQGGSGFMESYKNFMSVAANHMTVLAPVVPSLTAML